MKNKKYIIPLIIIFLILVNLFFIKSNLFDLDIIKYLFLVFILPLIISMVGAFLYMRGEEYKNKKNFIFSITNSLVLTTIISGFQKVYITENVKNAIMVNSEYIKGMNISFESGGVGSVILAFLIFLFFIYNSGKFGSKSK